MTWVWIAAGVAVFGGGMFAGVKVAKHNQPETPVVIEQPPPVVITGSTEGEELVKKDLGTDTCKPADFMVPVMGVDGVKVGENVDMVGKLLCDARVCWQNQRGVDSQVSSADCASLSNAAISLIYIDKIDQSCDFSTEENDQFTICSDRYEDLINSGKSGQ